MSELTARAAPPGTQPLLSTQRRPTEMCKDEATRVASEGPVEPLRLAELALGHPQEFPAFEGSRSQAEPRPSQPLGSSNRRKCAALRWGSILFTTRVLLEALREDHSSESSSHDFGADVLPRLVESCRRVYAFDFAGRSRKEAPYWRDVGTLDAYYEATMDLVSVSPEFNLYDEQWPLRTEQPMYPPAKFVFAEGGRHMGVGVNSMVCAGCIVSGGRVVNSVLSPGVRVNSHSEVESSILFRNVVVGRHSRIRRAIIDGRVQLPEHTEIGFDIEQDRRKGHFVTESGIVVVHSASPGVEKHDHQNG